MHGEFEGNLLGVSCTSGLNSNNRRKTSQPLTCTWITGPRKLGPWSLNMFILHKHGPTKKVEYGRNMFQYYLQSWIQEIDSLIRWQSGPPDLVSECLESRSLKIRADSIPTDLAWKMLRNLVTAVNIERGTDGLFWCVAMARKAKGTALSAKLEWNQSGGGFTIGRISFRMGRVFHLKPCINEVPKSSAFWKRLCCYINIWIIALTFYS